MKRPRILHLRASNFVGGPEHQLLRHAESELNGPREILLGSFIGPEEGSEFLRGAEARGIQTLSLPSRNLGPRSALPMLIRALKSYKIDLLCTHGFKADVLGVLAARSAGVPIACFLRGWTAENRKVRIYEAADVLSLRFADRIVCLSAAQASKIQRFSALKPRVRIVGNAIDVPAADEGSNTRSREEIIRRFGLPSDCAIVATAGRLSPEKATIDFVEAASRVSRQHRSARFLVFGEGVLRHQLERKARALGLEGRIVFTGFQRDLRKLLPGVDLLVNPSHSEEMPNAVLEAMASAIPVIATAVGGVEEIAGPWGAVYLVPPRNPEILANAIGQLLSEPSRAKALGQLGRTRVQTRYSLARQSSEFHSLYDEFVCLPKPDSSGAILDVLSPVFQQGSPCEHQLPFLSVVLPVRNEEACIGTVLRELEAQDYPHDRLEIIVSDGNSSDRTAEVVMELARQTSLSIQLLGNPAQLSSAGRNVGARNARGEYLIFIDGHCHIPHQSFLRDAVDVFERSKADCLSRPGPLTMPGSNGFQDVVGHARGTFLGHGRDSTIYATDFEGFCNPCSSGAFYRRNVFDRIGFYDESFDACEDVEFNYRVVKAGLSSYFSARLALLYQPRSTLRDLWRQMTRYGRGRFRLLRKHPEAFSLSQLVPVGLLVGLILGGIAPIVSAQLGRLYFASIILYLLVVLGFSAALGVRYGIRHLLQAPGVYLTIHFGLATGFLTELVAVFAGNRRRRKTAVDSGKLVRPTISRELSNAKPTGQAEGS
jgi:succinoglycan biosynthesis protein ExoA